MSLLQDLEDDLREMAERGYVECRICHKRFYGEDFGEVLQALGEHGEKAHLIRIAMEREHGSDFSGQGQ